MDHKETRRETGNRNLYIYTIYWIAYLLFFSVQRFFARRYFLSGMGLVEVDNLYAFKESFFTNLAYLPEVIISTHFVVSFLVPKFYFRNRFYLFTLLLCCTILFYPVLPYLVRTYIVEVYMYQRTEEYSFYNYFAAMMIFVFGLAPLAWFKIGRHLREDAIFHQKLDNDRLAALLKLKEAELKLLRSQLHPHFLFNTLNNLYSLALEKSDKTPDLLIRLGDMLSYIIYDCNSEKVQLSKEVDFINSFIELQKVRYVSCDISFTTDGEIGGQKIAPMLLHTFIENSFKHGADKDSGNPWIRIKLSLNNGTLSFSVKNSKRKVEDNKRNGSGIGIENTRKRLDMLYRQRYELTIDDNNEIYSVSLKLLL